MTPDSTHEELKELRHAEQPGYRKIFYMVFALASALMAIYFIVYANTPAQH